MIHFGKRSRRPVIGALVAIITTAVVLAAPGSAGAASRTSTPHPAAASSSAMVGSSPTASTSTSQVKSHSYIRGTTANGRHVTGQFRPRTFTTSGDQILATGRLRLVIHRLSDNSVKRVIVKRGATIPVKTINGTTPGQTAPTAAGSPAAAAAAAATSCPVLHLVLGPLHLNLLGLVINLNRVVLNITAVPGPGNLLGNLLCAVAHLLDNTGLGTQLGQIATLLNSILAILQA